jgi:YD repeat-containing protein
VIVNDGSRFNFEYTSWGQVWKIRNHASDGHLLNYRSYDLPQTNAVPLQDCPRFTERRDWAENWNRSGAPGPAGLPAGPEQEVITRYDVPVSVSWTSPNGSFETGTLARVTAPDGTYNKIYFAGAAPWRRGLPAYVETYNSVDDLQRQVVTTWTQDTATSTNYEVNPRITETNTYDPSGKRVRVVIGYQTVTIGDGTTCKLPQDISEYQADASTVLRRTHTTYKLTTPYISRRIIGLPLEKSLYEVDPNTLTETPMSKVEFYYDESPIEGAADPVAIQHDNTNFGVNFLVGRANLTSVRRYDVQNDTQFTTTTNKYNRTGSLVSAKDAVGHEVTLSYTDAFATNADPLDTQRPFKTFAYPTRVDDADGYSTRFRYNYDFGARTWQQTPLPNVTANTPGPVQTFSYDVKGRLIRITSVANNAFTRYNYGPNYVETFSSVNSIVETANEGHRLIVFDGLGRTIVNANDHPNSTGGFSAQLVLYDRMGRVQKQSNPTETNISITGNPINPTQFAALGDDAPANGGFGWKYMEQTYDWKGRPLVTTNQDGTTKEVSYEGCGCAGGEVVTVTDEGTTVDIDSGQAVNNVTKKRQRKTYSDVLGRTIKTEILNWQGGSEYSTTVVAYNARDQVTAVKQYQGIEGGAIFQETSMTYDGFGRLKTRKVPEQKADVNINGSTDHTTWEYNADDTVQSITDARGITTTFGYNARHLLTSISYPPAQNGIPATSNVTYDYDAAGNRTAMSNPSGNNAGY